MSKNWDHESREPMETRNNYPTNYDYYLTVFNYEGGLHNILRVNATAYDNCVKEPNLGAFGNGNDTITLAEVGRFWYICGVVDHCKNGQKLSVEVLP
ncbi:Plastocyanin-like [Macleaya cordata]|uniref:Plastocyanin-like n=1 Tax=Macleaya cordata TaxID=56857 RepID=A0A200QNV2_MACCD|nr:Plastocyanin-like [Macleaya cordata]